MVVMQHLLLLTIGIALVYGQQSCQTSCSNAGTGSNACTCTSSNAGTGSNACSGSNAGTGSTAGTGSPCNQNVTVDPQGVDPWQSPFYGILSSAQRLVNNTDCRCSTFFILPNGKTLLINTLSRTDRSYLITKSIRQDVPGTPGAYMLTSYQGNNGASSCTYNDYTLAGLNTTCAGTFVLQRCLSGNCTSQYNSVLAFYSALRPQPSSCRSSINTLLQQQGFGSLTLYDLPNKCCQCVCTYNNLTAINANCINKAQRLDIMEGDLSSCS